MRTPFSNAAAIDLEKCGEIHADKVFESLKKHLGKLFTHKRMEGYELSSFSSENPDRTLTVTRDRKFCSRFEVSYCSEGKVSIKADSWIKGQYEPGRERCEIVDIAAMNPDDAATAIIMTLTEMDDRFNRRLFAAPPTGRAHSGSSPNGKRFALA